MNEVKYKIKISSILMCSPEQVFLYWKGRVALYAILKSMGVQKDDEVIIPAFTCVVVPNAILYLGATPIYVDIRPETYNMDPDKVEPVITTKTKAIICQNTFGLSTNIEQIIKIAKKYNLFTIEDCAHGFGGHYNGKPNGSYCDAAFYSTQWNKPFSTGLGGILIVNNKDLIEAIKCLECYKIKPSVTEKLILTVLIFTRSLIINEFSYWVMVKFFRFLSKNNLIVGSNQGEELSGNKIPENYFKNISSIQIYAGLKKLELLDKVNLLRMKNAMDYTRILKVNKKVFVSEELFDNHLFLKYPLLVKDRELFFRIAEKEKIMLGDWFLSPIHPVLENLESWNFNHSNFPIATGISKQIVNLPTDTNENRKVLEFISRNISLIY